MGHGLTMANCECHNQVGYFLQLYVGHPWGLHPWPLRDVDSNVFSRLLGGASRKGLKGTLGSLGGSLRSSKLLEHSPVWWFFGAAKAKNLRFSSHVDDVVIFGDHLNTPDSWVFSCSKKHTNQRNHLRKRWGWIWWMVNEFYLKLTTKIYI